MRIGITGASGQLGTGLLRHLLQRVSASDIVAITRTPAKLNGFSAQGVRVRAGDFTNASELAHAFDDIERLLIIPTSDLQPDVRPPLHRGAMRAAVAAGVSHIVYVSSVGARPSISDGILETHFSTELALIASQTPWTLLRMSVYADTLIDSAKRAAASGIYSGLVGAPAAYVGREDVAAAAAGILTGRGHEGVTYHATGPSGVTSIQIAEIISRIAGIRVTFTPLTIEQFEGGLASVGLPPAVVTVLSKFQRAVQMGVFDLVTGDVERLAGKKAESLDDFLARSLRQSTAQGGHH